MARFWRRVTGKKEEQPVVVRAGSETPLISRTLPKLENHVSVYHVYHNGQFHHRLTPERDDHKDRPWPTWSETREYIREQRQKKTLEKSRPPNANVSETEAPGFFVHKPRVCFRHPPRTLRLGQSKLGAPLCLIHNSWLWRRWQIQFCDGLDEPGVVDPRGVVGTENGYANRRDSVQQGGYGSSGFVQGYPVREGRFWGDSGKNYHRSVNERRREGEHSFSNQRKPLEVSTVINLTWDSPFSPRTRRYNFCYENLDFSWKGTGTVQHPGFCGAFTRFNHLKLTVRVPASESHDLEPVAKSDHTVGMDEVTNKCGGGEEIKEVVLATYTSSPAARKSGTLEVRDRELLWLLSLYFPGQYETVEIQRELHDDVAETSVGRGPWSPEQVAKTQLYQCIIATAMCMVIAEHQKREWVKHILELAAGEAGSAGG